MPSSATFGILQERLVDIGVLANRTSRDLDGDDEVPGEVIAAISDAARLAGVELSAGLSDVRIVDQLERRFDIQDLIDRLTRARCGVPERVRSGIQIQTFGSPGGRWSRGALTVSVNPAGANMPANAVTATILNAFMRWQAASPFFTFTPVPAN